jgi:UDP-glucose 4-epimerase
LSTGKLQNLPWSHPELQFIKGDILDYPLVRKLVAGCDAVLHLAAIVSVPQSIEDPIQSCRVNTQGFVHLLQAIRELKQPTRLVYASSAAVYGAAVELPCCDDLALADVALSPYALEKANCERYAALFTQLFGLTCLGLRYFNVYGTRQDPASPYSGVISKFMGHYLQDKPITIFGDGEHSRDFVHVSDVAKANWLALQSHYCGALNVATGVPETLINLVRYIEAAGGRPAEVNYAAARLGDIVKSFATIEKAEQQLNFRSSVPLIQGIRSLYETAGE